MKVYWEMIKKYMAVAPMLKNMVMDTKYSISKKLAVRYMVMPSQAGITTFKD
jgi:hypothetical protein